MRADSEIRGNVGCCRLTLDEIMPVFLQTCASISFSKDAYSLFFYVVVSNSR